MRAAAWLASASGSSNPPPDNAPKPEAREAETSKERDLMAAVREAFQTKLSSALPQGLHLLQVLLLQIPVQQVQLLCVFQMAVTTCQLRQGYFPMQYLGIILLMAQL